MFTLLDCLYNLMSHILEEHVNDLPSELYPPLKKAMDAVENWLEANR